jgi:hypothetical protein
MREDSPAVSLGHRKESADFNKVFDNHDDGDDDEVWRLRMSPVDSPACRQSTATTGQTCDGVAQVASWCDSWAPLLKDTFWTPPRSMNPGCTT